MQRSFLPITFHPDLCNYDRYLIFLYASIDLDLYYENKYRLYHYAYEGDK